jgi:hypothetical protein
MSPEDGEHITSKRFMDAKAYRGQDGQADKIAERGSSFVDHMSSNGKKASSKKLPE